MDLMEAMKKAATDRINNDGVVMVEFDISSTELHNIANGNCCSINDGQFGLRFLLSSSFKSPRSSFVINKFKVQLVVNNKSNFLRKENIAVKTKVIKAPSKVKKKEVKVKEKIKLEIDNKQTNLWGD